MRTASLAEGIAGRRESLCWPGIAKISWRACARSTQNGHGQRIQNQIETTSVW